MTAWALRTSRRHFLTTAAGVGGLVALGVSGSGPAAADVIPAVPTVASLIADPVFYVAHRGGGRDWPEMTRYAYVRAAQIRGVKAVEVSVQLSADGVLVCSHDATTSRLGSQDLVIAKENWSTLAALWVSPRETINPLQPSRKFSRLSDVLGVLDGKVVIYAEPKSSAAASLLLETLTDYGRPDQIVWKQPINSKRFAHAKDAGFATWGYVLDEPAHLGNNLTRYAASDAVDMLGAPLSENDDFIRDVVAAADANDKLVTCWSVNSFLQRARAVRLGARGLMSGAIRELIATPI